MVERDVNIAFDIRPGIDAVQQREKLVAAIKGNGRAAYPWNVRLTFAGMYKVRMDMCDRQLHTPPKKEQW